ncbi:MAG: cation-translocating P-type ATPase [Dermatophilaceae bacterium]
MFLVRALTSAVTLAQSGLSAASDVVGGTSRRRSWLGAGRAWIEVRGLDGPDGDDTAVAIVAALRALPGVQWVELNRTLSRVVVALQPQGPSLAALSAVVSHCEEDARDAGDEPGGGGAVPPVASRSVGGTDLPGDAVVLAGRMVALGADAVGLAAAVAGRAIRLPRLPGAVTAAVTLIDVQPRLRRVVEARLGTDAADVVLAVATAAAQTLAQGPASLAVDLTLRAALVAEGRASARAWERHEPALSEQAASDQPFPAMDRPRPRPAGPIEKYADAAALTGVLGAGVIGVATGRVGLAADAVLVAAPRATRTTRESFSTTLSRHLCDDHDVLVLRGGALRRLDRVDALVIDPAALLTQTLTVGEVRGAEGSTRAALWAAARADADNGLLGPGWHPVRALSPTHDELGAPPDAQVLVTAVPDPLAGAIVSAARHGRVELVSLDVEELGALRAAFDDLRQRGETTDAGLRDAVEALQAAGRTVALLAVDAPQALAAADVALALTRPPAPPGWTADLLLPDLSAAWRVLNAVPAARAASRRGVELSAGGSLLGALLMLPGVRGRGPGPVIAAAAVGLLSGRAAALRVAALPLPQPAPVIDFHAMSADDVVKALSGPGGRAPRTSGASQSRPWSALPAAGAGLWSLASAPLVWGLSMVGAARGELADPLTPILATGAAASAVLGSPVDAVLVASVVIGNAVLSAAQRLRAERLLGRLLAGQDAPARLLTTEPEAAPAYIEVASDDLRPGEVIEIRAGEVVPADARLLTAEGVEVDESSLTGESLPVLKDPAPTPGAPLAERACMLFEGTILLTGIATALVTAVGPGTEAGRAAALSPPAAHDVGLQAQLGRLTARVLPVTVGGGLVVTLLGLLRGAGLREAVTSGVSISVAAVPEGLPLVATLAQQAAARRLTRHGVLVRSPRAIEALGRVDVVCFDKTGTLSENKLRVASVQPRPGWARLDVLGAAARTCPQATAGQTLSHATDVAVLEAFAAPAPRRQAELPFRAGRPFAAAVSGAMLSVKGAPEVLIATAGAPAALSEQVHEMAGQGLRVLAVAQRRLTAAQAAAAASNDAALEDLCREKLDIIGLIGLADTPRPDAVGLLPTLIAGGRSVRVITGDHPQTAMAIVRELGLPAEPGQVMTGAEWAQLSHQEQQRAAERVVVFARMSPEQKVAVVQVLETAGHVCAMVGDGANDAAAIRAASVGIGVASHGSDPARGAADVVLTDGKIGSLLEALEEGGQLWRRVQGALSVLLGGNAGEVAFTMIGTAVSGRAPLNARQLLLVNMLTDALPAAAVAVSPARTAPTAQTRGLDQAQLWRTIALRGTATTLGATSAWSIAKLTGRARRASTIALIALVATQLGQTLLDSPGPLVLITAGGSLSVLAVLVSTPVISQLLGCTPLGPIGWTQALSCATGATVLAGVAPRLLSKLTLASDPAGGGISAQPGRHPGATTPSTAAAPVG